MISETIADAFNNLVQVGLVQIHGGLQQDGPSGAAVFICELPVPQPNVEGLPPSVEVRVQIPAEFPHAKVTVTPVDPSLRGFAHQDGCSGAFCLKPGKHPVKARDRLRAYMEDAIEWVADAANKQLLVSGQPWELPDFNTLRRDRPPAIFVLESEDSFPVWKDRIGQCGFVQFASHVRAGGLVAVGFDQKGQTVHEARVTEGFLNRAAVTRGAWVLLPTHIYIRNRASRSFSELARLCSAVGVDIWRLVRRAVKEPSLFGYNFILVGAPIPRFVGAPDCEIHWQAIAISEESIAKVVGRKAKKNRGSERGHSFRDRLNGMLSNAAVPWGPCVNVDPSRVEKRGVIDHAVQRSRICVLGCGAVGSLIAEHLARGGAHDLSLFDSETLELENLSRHTLGVGDVGKNKAVALADRINGIHPLAHVRGFPFGLPLRNIPKKTERPGWDLLGRSDVLIDCTSNDIVFRWGSWLGRKGGKRVVHIFLNAHARMLTICCSGQHTRCAKVAGKLFVDIKEGRADFTWDDYDPDAEEIYPGAGCWHPTFPALGSDIAALVAAAMPLILELLSRPMTSRGMALVLRREVPEVTRPTPQSLVQIAWVAEYR